MLQNVGSFVPKIRVPFGVPVIRIVVSRGLYWSPLISGNYHLCFGAGLENMTYMVGRLKFRYPGIG